MNPKFTVVVVSFNPGEKINKTVASIVSQTYRNFEIIVKDGNSTDGSISNLAQEYSEVLNSPLFPCLTVIKGKDKGIYDAMNIALDNAQGQYVIFMNCGDTFYSENVLANTVKRIEEVATGTGSLVLYGDVYSEQTKTVIPAPSEITGFTCYRNIPCHQACFYSISLFHEKRYELEYKIRADYDHFLWCYYRGNAEFVNLECTVASYEGGGYSESEENRLRDEDEHKLITSEYMSKAELTKYRAVMALTLAPIRKAIADNPKLAKTYQTIKRKIYK